MITNASITKIVAENCPDAFEIEDVSHSRGLEIHHGPNGGRSVIVRQFNFAYTEIANLFCDFAKAGCDVDVNIVPCPEDSQVVTLEVELSVPEPGIDFDKVRQKPTVLPGQSRRDDRWRELVNRG